MRICFLHPGKMKFNVETPFYQPLGGTESAICYLLIELAKLGHEVYLLNNIDQSGDAYGVINLPYLQTVSAKFFHQISFDVVVVINGSRLSTVIKPMLPAHTRLLLWISLDIDQQPLHALLDSETRRLWDAYIVLSEYQHQRLVNYLHVDMDSCFVIRYAVAPSFENLFVDANELTHNKMLDLSPSLAYTSTPYRGLKILLDIYPQFQRLFPRAVLHIYSSMKVYQHSETEKEGWLEELYEKSRSMKGVKYWGSISQPQLAEKLRSVSILAYPNTYAETACIAVMEAMASGCLVVTSELGALPETANRFCHLIPVAFRSLEDFSKEYYDALVSVFMEFFSHPKAITNHLWEQVQYMNTHYTWHKRAKEWIETLNRLN